jgi:type VI secretion system protein ImpA
MASPETVDLAALMAPIPGDSPAGESLLFSDVYDKIQQARRTERSQFDDGDARGPDYKAVVRLTTEALTARSKDLQAAVWLADALARTDGFAGVRDGLHVLRVLHETYWETFHPVVEDGDLGMRANRLAWLNESGEGRDSLAVAIAFIPLTDPLSGVEYGWAQFRESRDVDNLAKQSAEKYERALAEGRITGEKFDAAVAAGSRRFYERVAADVTAALEEATKLQEIILARYTGDAPSLLNVKGALEEVHHVLERIVEEKRRLEPDPIQDQGGAESVTSAGPGVVMVRATGIDPVDRADALRRLGAVAAFFRRTEPHSPVAYLVQRAIRWADMPLDVWLREVVANDDVLSRVKETLGIKEPG